jgi:RinA family phage transcriptional activator
VKLRKSTFRYIEQEIYSYYETRKRAEELTIDIAYSTPPQHEIRSTDISDPTFVTANILATHKERLRMIDTVQAIHASILALDPEIYDVLNDKYWIRPYLSWINVAVVHNVGKSTLYEWRSHFVGSVARRLGVS